MCGPAEHVAQFFRRCSTLAAARRAGVAVSGGADSLALLHLLAEWASGAGAELHVIHFNHGLRGGEADADERFVAEQAAALGLAFHSTQGRMEPGANLEARARRERLRWFAEVKAAAGLGWIATGHTRDDQAETVLLRLLRGTSTTGLAGILPVTCEGLVRPLLECDRQSLREWLRERGIGWREDRTNFDPGFAARNRARLDLLPVLRREWNPQIDATLAQMAELARDEEEFWAGQVARYLPEPATAGRVFEVAVLQLLPVALQRRLLRAAIEREQGHLRRIEFQHVERALQLVRRERGDGRLVLPGGLVVERSFGQIRVGRRRIEQPKAVHWRNLERRNATYNGDSDLLDGARLAQPLELRGWLPGDEFQPRGAKRARKVKQLFQTARVPVWLRGDWPLLASGGTVVWMRGFGVAEGFSAGAESLSAVEVVDEAQEDFHLRGPKLESKGAAVASMVVDLPGRAAEPRCALGSLELE